MKPLKEKISITIDGDILEKLREKAEYDDRSLSQYINIILKEEVFTDTMMMQSVLPFSQGLF